MTAEEYFARADEFERTELVDGEVVEVPPTGYPRGFAEVRLGRFLDEHVEKLGGAVVSGEVGYQLSDVTVRGADVAVHLRCPETGRGWTKVPPDLVVEVLSPRDTWRAVHDKVDDWLAFGVREVWIADPERRSVEVRRADGMLAAFTGEAELTSPLLPGFAVALARLFA
jgi:Uma2 family endonuclease